MDIPLFVCVLVLTVLKVESLSVCDQCLCSYDSQGGRDVHGQDVDCSYIPGVYQENITMPTTVYSLDLSSNNITVLKSYPFFRSKTMIELFLNSNNIAEIASANVFDLPNLKKLDLNNNKLEMVQEDVFRNLRSLEYLNLANNNFANLVSFQHLSNLNELILDNNNIGPMLRHTNIFDRKGYGVTKKLKSLSISGVQLNVVPANFFSDVYDIRKIVISNNNLSDTFEIPITLEYLDLSDNPIKEFGPEDFSESPGLKTLKLNNLAITEVPEFAFYSLRALVTLELERNKNLTQFSPYAFGQEVLEDPDDFLLESLSLRGSRLTGLDEQLLDLFGQLTRLDLQGNPWRCDCRLVWLKKLQIPKNDYEHLRCASPKPLNNKNIFEIKEKSFVCPPDKHYVGIAIAAVALCAVLSCTAIWLFFILPRYQTRSRLIQNMYASTTAYSVLPLSRSEI